MWRPPRIGDAVGRWGGSDTKSITPFTRPGCPRPSALATRQSFSVGERRCDGRPALWDAVQGRFARTQAVAPRSQSGPFAAVELPAANGGNAAFTVIAPAPVNWCYRPEAAVDSSCRERSFGDATWTDTGRSGTATWCPSARRSGTSLSLTPTLRTHLRMAPS